MSMRLYRGRVVERRLLARCRLSTGWANFYTRPGLHLSLSGHGEVVRAAELLAIDRIVHLSETHCTTIVEGVEETAVRPAEMGPGVEVEKRDLSPLRWPCPRAADVRSTRRGTEFLDGRRSQVP